MIQILHIPGIQYKGETPEQAEERDRRTMEANRKMREEWEEDQRQRALPMKSMRQWAEDRGQDKGGEVIALTPRPSAS